MKFERAGLDSRAHPNANSPAKQIPPQGIRKTVSIASIFKQQPRDRKATGITSNTPKLKKDLSAAKLLGMKSRSISHSQQKSSSRVSKRQSDVHPLAVAFRGKVKRRLQQARGTDTSACRN